MTSDLFDPRLLKAVVKTVDVSYGGESGFNQAIELSAEALSSVKLVQEKKLLQKYFDEISQVLHFTAVFFIIISSSHSFCEICRGSGWGGGVFCFILTHSHHLGHWKVLLHGAGHAKGP